MEMKAGHAGLVHDKRVIPIALGIIGRCCGKGGTVSVSSSNCPRVAPFANGLRGRWADFFQRRERSWITRASTRFAPEFLLYKMTGYEAI